MASSTVYIGNLDDRVSERVLYDILIQAGRVVDLHIPRERDTEKRKGYAFAQYESDEIANYAVKLFSGLVSLHSRTLKFGISGQDKVSNNTGPSSGNAAPHRPRPSFQLGRYNQVPPPPIGDGSGYDYSRRVFGSTMDGINRSRQPRRFDSGDPVSYPPY